MELFEVAGELFTPEAKDFIRQTWDEFVTITRNTYEFVKPTLRRGAEGLVKLFSN